jgi:hypothetical protein
MFDTWSDERDEVYDYSTWSEVGTDRSVPLLRRRPRAAPSQAFYQYVRIQGVKITLRVWDVKTQQARQMTIRVPSR